MSARCPCNRAGLADGCTTCALCVFDEVNGKPTVRPPPEEHCACGRPFVAGVTDCRGCPEGLFAAWLDVSARVAALPTRERIAFWVRTREHELAETAARLARGP